MTFYEYGPDAAPTPDGLTFDPEAVAEFAARLARDLNTTCHMTLTRRGVELHMDDFDPPAIGALWHNLEDTA